MTLQKVCVVGCGLMGSGIAQVCAVAGYHTLVRDVAPPLIDKGLAAMLDLVGIDTTYYIAEILFDEYREKRFAPPPLMKRMVLAGMYGRKTGKGFCDYGDPKNPRVNRLLEA
jgi:3-hydroxyacyl-CoA dehydrogenase